MISADLLVSVETKIREIEQEAFAAFEMEAAAGQGNASLLNGFTGLVILYYELYTHFKEEAFKKKAIEIINLVLQKTHTSITTFAYCDGLAGIAFLFNYLREKEFIGASIDGLLADCDELLITIAQQLLKQANLDYLHGALGIGHYLLERLPQASNPAALLATCETLVAQVAQQLEEGLSLNEFVPAHAADQCARYVNCGLAHGLVANLLFLSKYLPVSPQPARVRATLVAAQQLLRRHQSADEATLSAYPSIVKLTGDTVEASYTVPLGWCYGDTVVSLGLHQAGRALGDEALVAEAQALAHRAARRNTLATAAVKDAGFCHGSSSIAHTYRTWLAHTGDERFAAHYQAWIAHTLALGHHADSPGGYKKFTGATYTTAFGLLDGVAGVALVLLDFLRGPAPSDWDRFFLLS